MQAGGGHFEHLLNKHKLNKSVPIYGVCVALGAWMLLVEIIFDNVKIARMPESGEILSVLSIMQYNF